MSRPTRTEVDSGALAWDAAINDNLIALFDRPIPLYVHSGDLASLQATYPAASYDQSLAFVDYDGGSTPGLQLAYSNGTEWLLSSNWQLAGRFKVTALSTAGAVADNDDLIVTTGGTSFTIDLPAVADSNEGRVIRIKASGTGTITVDPNASETIDGAATLSLSQYDYTELVSDGTQWLQVTGGGSGGGGGSSTFLGLTDTPGSFGTAGQVVAVNGTTDGLEFVAASGAAASIPIIVAVGDETTALTTGTAKVTFRMPYAFTLTAVRASLTTASSSGVVTVDINEGGVSILSTLLTIDQSETTSTTAATAPVISDSSLADDAEITIDVDTAGTGAAGLKVTLIGTAT